MAKGQRADEEILADIRDALTWDTRIDERFVEVSVRDGIVSLTGSVNTFAEKAIIHDVIDRIKGVIRVIDHTQIRPAEIKGDEAIAVELMNALKSDPRVDERNISVKVARGVATLSGTVSTVAERRAAVEDAWYTVGVASVVDDLKILPPQIRADVDVEEDVRSSLAADARISEPSLILVKSRGGRVYLRGGTLSPSERKAAVENAWSVPGVVDVVNELAIVYGTISIPPPSPGTRLARS